MTEGQAPPPPPPPPTEPPAQPPPPPPGYQPPAPAPAAAPSGGYPARYEVDFQGTGRDRVTTFFRLILAIPWLIVLYVYALVGEVLVIISWFALVITGRYPETLYNWNSGILRYGTSVSGWLHLVTDRWPSFGWSQDPSQPQRVLFAPPAAKQSRLKVAFRLILFIPLLFVAWAINYVSLGAAFASWFMIVFRAYQPRWLFDTIVWTMQFQLRIGAYIALLTDVYPPVGEDAPKLPQALADANRPA